MNIDYLIVGQGLSGTWLSYFLELAQKSVIVIDEGVANSASRVSSGIINPVTGRRMSKTWLADDLLPFARDQYAAIDLLINSNLPNQDRTDTASAREPSLSPVCILDYFAAPDRRLDFERRAREFDDYLKWPADQEEWAAHLNYGFGFGIISPAYKVQVQPLIINWRQHLVLQNKLLAQKFEAGLLSVNSDGVAYDGIHAKAIIFCDGAAATKVPWFNRLPFHVNKGEALIVEIPELPEGDILKQKNSIIPMGNHLFWVGSSYDNEFTHDQPSPAFREEMENWLTHFVKHPFKVVDHQASLRPSNEDRRPFVGMHPQMPTVGVLNGMGTKGVSLAPFFARQMADLLVTGSPVLPEASLAKHLWRFKQP